MAHATSRLAFPTVIGDQVWWQEMRPEEGGRATVVHQAADGHRTELIGARWNARSRVHEYGGIPYLPVPAAGSEGWDIVFANYADQRLYLVSGTAPSAAPDSASPAATPAGDTGAADPAPAAAAGTDPDAAAQVPGAAGAGGTAAAPGAPGAPDTATGAEPPPDGGTGAGQAPARAGAGAPGAGAPGAGAPGAGAPGAGTSGPRPLTPEPAEPAGLRYADFVLSPDRTEIWCVREQHAEGRITRAIVAIPLDGSAASDAAAVREIVTGSDFYAYPTPSPDGSRLAWIGWNHPRMPWDGTELRVAVIQNGVAGKARLVKGGVTESVLAPSWRDDSSLYVVSDWSGWWNIYQVSLADKPHQALYPAEEEFAGPLWQLGPRPYAVLGDGRLAVLHGQVEARLGLLDPDSGELTDFDLPHTDFASGLSAAGDVVVALAGGPTIPPTVIRLHVADGSAEPLQCELEKLPDASYLPIPRAMEIEGPFGRVVHALVYPPSNPAATAPPGELPPYVVWAHGGPTAHDTSMLDLEKAYFTSRGIGVIDVNYGGSTGYGRAYRERLRREWGVVDVEDVIVAARGLAADGAADPGRLAIRGKSAGGWTALCAVTTGAAKYGPVFSAAASHFGPVSLEEFVRETHDFESHYIDGLIGPLPGFEAAYRERSPAGHVTKATSPILVLQGMDDPVVPPEQSEAIVRELDTHGIRHAYLAFEGESHGFRRAENVIAALEAELSFYGQILGFTPPGVPVLKLEGDS